MSAAPLRFTGLIPENYDRYLAPILFRPFAQSMAVRIGDLKPSNVLEVACGTGVVTRYLAGSLPAEARVVATDLSQSMLDFARTTLLDAGSIEWQTVDACALPFEDASFDVIACQFGAMFFPDKPLAMMEAFRVLAPGGHLLFSTWGPISMNPLFSSIERTLETMFPEEETPFMPTPFSMSDVDGVRCLVRDAGFRYVGLSEETQIVGPNDPASLAAGFAYGTPLGIYLSDRGYDVGKIYEALTAGFAADLGDPMMLNMQALVCHATKNSS